MDDILDSVNTVKEAEELSRAIDDILANGCFKVKEWRSNEILNKYKATQEMEEIKVPQETSGEKVLGVVWIYDPIGFASAFLIRAKIGIQELWQKGINWDDELSPESQEQWLSFFEEMKKLNDVHPS
jgi:hypothetical protein